MSSSTILQGRRWIKDIVFAQTVYVVSQYLCLWDMFCDFHLSDQPNRFIWKWSSSWKLSSPQTQHIVCCFWAELA
jgi:hypothetical protein